MHALIIEQDAWVVFTIEDVLGECGYTSTDVATTYEDAIEQARVRSPDLLTSALRL
jgi:DNA-binding response OmpR family regulator